MENNDFTKEAEIPMNLKIEDKFTIESNDSTAPPTPKQPFFIGNNISYLVFFIFQFSNFSNFFFTFKKKKKN